MSPSRDDRVYREEVVVLRRVSTGETDRVLTLFTRTRGKLGAIAKGARGPRSRLSAVTEPFTCFRGLLAQGQNLDVLTQGEVRSAFLGLRRDLHRIAAASYLIELVDAGTPERQPLPGLWDLLVRALAVLEEARTPDVVARAFELQAMAELGYEAQLRRCAGDGAPAEGSGAGFHPARGGMLCAACARTAPGTIPLSAASRRALVELAEADLARCADLALPAEVRSELARALVAYVRHHLESPLRSLAFLNDLHAVRTRPPGAPA